MHDDELAEREATRTLAREVTQSLANGQPSQAISGVLDEADRADHESSEQIDSLIRGEHPEAFDKRGRLRKRALASALAKRLADDD